MHVAFVYGPFPPDEGLFDSLVARGCELTIYGTEWEVATQWWRPAAPAGDFRVRRFSPILRTSRGHLWHWYPGMRRALEIDRPDIAHVVSEPWGALPVRIASFAPSLGIKLVVHGCDRTWDHGSRAERWIRRRLGTYTLSRTDAFAGESEKAIATAGLRGLASHAPAAVVHTNARNGRVFAPIGSAAEQASVREHLGLPREGVGIVYAGRLVPDKGVLDLLDAARHLPRDGRAWIAIAGKGPLGGEVEHRIQALGNRAFFLGALGYPHEVVRMLQSADIVVIPSRTTRTIEEQGSRIAVEAMLCGCSIVGSSSGAIAETIGDGGIVYPHGDVPSLAGALMTLVQDPALRNELGEKALLRAHDRYTADAIAMHLLKLWESILRMNESGLEDPPQRVSKGPSRDESPGNRAEAGL